jgi:hypothetical protein
MNKIKLGIYNVGGILVAMVMAIVWAIVMMLSAIVHTAVVLYHCVITLYQHTDKRRRQ